MGTSGTEDAKENTGKIADRRNVENNITTKAEYLRRWGVPYPQ
jgi:hypothetical protein